MKIYIKKLSMILLLINILSTISIFSQNEIKNREAYVLKIPVDGEQFYEQNIENSPYFIKDKILQIYPEEKLFIEMEVEGKNIVLMKVVKMNTNPEKTIVIEFTQTIKDNKNELMMLKIVNPFNYDLTYKAKMFILGNNKLLNTDVLPVKAKLTSFETWKDVIISLVLFNWELK